MNLAEQWYERAARQGHEEAQGALGLILFQNGRRREAMPWIERAANRGDPRAQYVLGTALFNGDLVARDGAARLCADEPRRRRAACRPRFPSWRRWSRTSPRRSAAAAAELAGALPSAPRPTELAAATRAAAVPARACPRRARRRRVQRPGPAARPATGAPARPGRAAPLPPPVASAGGRWRIQLGAFASEANARARLERRSRPPAGPRPLLSCAPARWSGSRPGRSPTAPRRRSACAARAAAACFPVAP